MPKISEAYLEARAAEIATAAFECFAEKGFHGTSVADVAKRAGVSVGSIYRYFDGKEALFLALSRDAQESNARLWAEVGEKDGPSDRLVAFVTSYFDMLADPTCRASLALDLRLRGEALDSELVRRAIEDAYRRQYAEIRRLLAQAPGATSASSSVMAEALVGELQEASFKKLIDPKFDARRYARFLASQIERWFA